MGRAADMGDTSEAQAGTGANDGTDTTAARRAHVRPSRRLLVGARERIDLVRSSRLRTVAALGVGVLLASLAGAGAAAQIQQAGRDRASGVLAWLEYSDGSDFPGNDRVSVQLNVVNTGEHDVTVAEVDFEGGLEAGRTSGVSGRLAEPVTVVPGGHASQSVLAEVDDCSSGRMAQGGGHDGQLRVNVSGSDLRSTWFDGTAVGAYLISASTIGDMACLTGFETPVLVENHEVRADGDLYLSLRSASEDDVVVDVRGPDGVIVSSDPALPVTVPGQRALTIGLRLGVDTCTVDVQQLDAGNQVRLVVDEEEFFDLDYSVVNPWVVREVTRTCG